MTFDIQALAHIFANANHDGKIVEISAPGIAEDYRQVESLDMAGEGLVSITLTNSQLLFVIPARTIIGIRIREA